MKLLKPKPNLLCHLVRKDRKFLKVKKKLAATAVFLAAVRAKEKIKTAVFSAAVHAKTAPKTAVFLAVVRAKTAAKTAVFSAAVHARTALNKQKLLAKVANGHAVKLLLAKKLLVVHV